MLPDRRAREIDGTQGIAYPGKRNKIFFELPVGTYPAIASDYEYSTSIVSYPCVVAQAKYRLNDETTINVCVLNSINFHSTNHRSILFPEDPFYNVIFVKDLTKG